MVGASCSENFLIMTPKAKLIIEIRTEEMTPRTVIATDLAVYPVEAYYVELVSAIAN